MQYTIISFIHVKSSIYKQKITTSNQYGIVYLITKSLFFSRLYISVYGLQ